MPEDPPLAEPLPDDPLPEEPPPGVVEEPLPDDPLPEDAELAGVEGSVPPPQPARKSTTNTKTLVLSIDFCQIRAGAHKCSGPMDLRLS